MRNHARSAGTVVVPAGQVDNWQDLALCAETDPEAFFPEKGGSVREALKVCAHCDVTAECLADALDRGERYGVRGGTSEHQRRKMMPRRPGRPSNAH